MEIRVSLHCNSLTCSYVFPIINCRKKQLDTSILLDPFKSWISSVQSLASSSETFSFLFSFFFFSCFVRSKVTWASLINFTYPITLTYLNTEIDLQILIKTANQWLQPVFTIFLYIYKCSYNYFCEILQNILNQNKQLLNNGSKTYLHFSSGLQIYSKIKSYIQNTPSIFYILYLFKTYRPTESTV